jgi:hypothetical protein
MAESCSGHCGRKSVGSVGAMRFCYPCIAEMACVHRGDPRLLDRMPFESQSHGRVTGDVEWIPDLVKA